MLEKKREKRAAARLAAEAKQRRDHPRSSPVKTNILNSPSKNRYAHDYENDSVLESKYHDNRADMHIVQSNLSAQFASVMTHDDDNGYNAEEKFDLDIRQESEPVQQTIMEEEPYQSYPNEDSKIMEYHSQYTEPQSDEYQQQPQQMIASSTEDLNTSQTRNPPISPRKQPTTSARIQASHAEDVLTLSLELERTRSALKTANAHLADVQSHNEDLQSQLQSATASNDQEQSTQLSQLLEELRMEKNRSKAAEEDAALALELAKDAQAVKEECEEWLTRSLDEIEFWRNKCMTMEEELGKQEQLNQSLEEIEEENDDENKKLVRIKEVCPPSPVVSVQGGDVATMDEMEKMPPLPEYVHPSVKDDKWSTPQIAEQNRKFTFTPNSESSTSKADVAKGRLYLHNASPLLSPNGELSPHPRIRASELMKRSAETRRILRERLSATGRLDSSGPSPPPSMTHIATVAAKTKGNTTSSNSSQQGVAACKTVGKILYESGHRLELNGNNWNTNQGGSLVALETIAKSYCEQVEGKIGQQKEKIDELTAFCDHLEIDFINSR